MIDPYQEDGLLDTGRSLTELEEVVTQGYQTFMEVGLALAEIKGRRLYRETGFATFDEYCRERWDFGRSYAYQLIDSAEAALEMSTIVDTGVPNEGQARELTRLKGSPEVMADAYREASADGAPTAATVRAAVQRRLPVPSVSVPVLPPTRVSDDDGMPFIMLPADPERAAQKILEAYDGAWVMLLVEYLTTSLSSRGLTPPPGVIDAQSWLPATPVGATEAPQVTRGPADERLLSMLGTIPETAISMAERLSRSEKSVASSLSVLTRAGKVKKVGTEGRAALYAAV